MLSATSTRDLNHAARAAAKYLKEQGVELPHAKALDLVARTVGLAHHMAAQASLTDAGLLKPVTLKSYGDLKRALGALTEQQLAMSITVSEGCDSNGNAEFFPGYEFMRADSGAIHAATDGVLEAEQPVLLFNGPDEDDEQGGQAEVFGSVPFAVVEDLCRVLAIPDVDQALYDQGVSDAAYAAMAGAARFLRTEVLELLPKDVLQQAYDDLPVTASPQEFSQGHGNWSLSSAEMAFATRLMRLLTGTTTSGQDDGEEVQVARLAAQFEMGSALPGDVARRKVKSVGLARALDELNAEFDLQIALGPLLIASDGEQGFWCNDFGWTSCKMAASGFHAEALKPGTPSSSLFEDARMVPFSEAKDYEVKNR